MKKLYYRKPYYIVALLTIFTLFLVIVNSIGCNYVMMLESDDDGYKYEAMCQLGKFSYLNRSPNGDLSTTEGFAIALGSQVFHYVTERKIVKTNSFELGTEHRELVDYVHKAEPIPFFTYGFKRINEHRIALFEFPLENIYLAEIKGHISTSDMFGMTFSE